MRSFSSRTARSATLLRDLSRLRRCVCGGEATPAELQRRWLAAKAVVDGWFDTGDVFYRDADGCYVYCGCSEDMLKVAGRWVAPSDVEAALAAHPEVLESAVVGRSDELGLIKVEAWIVLRSRNEACKRTADDIRSWCKSRLAPYKYPHWIRFVDELPKAATGKIQRFRLRAERAGGDALH